MNLSLDNRTTAANTLNEPQLTQMTSKGLNNFDVSLPLILSPQHSSKLAAESETFRQTHFIKRGCRKLLEQASKSKEYEIRHAEKETKLHIKRLRSNFSTYEKTSRHAQQ